MNPIYLLHSLMRTTQRLRTECQPSGERIAHEQSCATDPSTWTVAGGCCGFVLVPEAEQREFYRGYGIFVGIGCSVFVAVSAALLAR